MNAKDTQPAVNRREFLEVALAGTVNPTIPTDRGDNSKAAGHGTAWMNEQPLVMSQPWQMPLYAQRAGGYPLWQDQNWDYAFTEDAAKEMKDIGVTAAIAYVFGGFGLAVERSYMEKLKEAAVLWHRYGIKVGAYLGSTLHCEAFLVEKPEAQQWLVPDYLGRPVMYGQQPDRKWPYFMHPGFREYTKRVLRLAIEDVKVDLILFDHTSMQAEPVMFFHPLAIADFRNYLLAKYTPAKLKLWLGTSDVRYVIPPKIDWPLHAIDNPLFQEWTDFRCEMLARYYEEMATFIHGLNPAVGILTNPHTGLSGINTAWNQGVDYPRLIPNMQLAWSEEGNYPDVTAEGILISEIRTFQMASILGARTGTYTGVPYTGAVPDENHMKLQMAQSMAYSRQCLGDIGPVHSLHKLPDGPRKYIRFFHDRFGLYRDLESAADVAVLHSYATLAYNNDRPYQSTWLFEQALIQSQIPFDIIFDEHLKDLSKYRILVLADQECLDERQCDLIRHFVQTGGGLVATEFTSLFTNKHVRRRDFELADLFGVPEPTFEMWVEDKPLSISPARHQVGQGRVVYVPEVKPAIVKPPAEPMTSRYWKLPLNREELIDAVRWAANESLIVEVRAPAAVTVNLLRQRKSGALQLHFINYGVSRDLNVGNIKVSFRLPAAATNPQMTIFSPDNNEVQPITYRTQNGRLECGLPSLNIYSLIEVRGASII